MAVGRRAATQGDAATVGLTDADRELRRGRISATAAGDIDRNELWRALPRIRGDPLPPEDAGPRALLGTLEEDAIATVALSELGWLGRVRVSQPGTTLAAAPDDEWACATPDRLLEGPAIGRLNLECKLVGRERFDEWGPARDGWNGIAARYRPQVLWQGWVLGVDGSLLAAQFGTEVRVYELPRRPDSEAALRMLCRRAWERYVRDRAPLPPDATPACTAALTARHPWAALGPPERIATTQGETHALASALAAAERVDAWTEARDRARNELRAYVGDGETLVVPGIGRATWGRSGRGGRTLRVTPDKPAKEATSE